MNKQKIIFSSDRKQNSINKEVNELTNNGIIIFNQKAKALQYINETKNASLKLFSEDIVKNTGIKHFLVATRKQIYDLIKTHNRNHLYENIEHNQKVKLHFDIDYKTDEYKRSILNVIFDKLVNEVVRDVSLALEKYDIVNPQILVLKSKQFINKNGGNKVSAHLIFTDVVFNDISDMKLFFYTIESKLINNKILDGAIYRPGCFRLINCSKIGKENNLYFYKTINFDYDSDISETSSIIFNDSLVTCINHAYYEIERNTIIQEVSETQTIKDITPKKYIQIIANNDESFIYLLNDIDFEYLIAIVKNIPKEANKQYIDWLLVTGAFKDLYMHIDDEEQKGKVIKIWDEWSKDDVKSYNKQNNYAIFNNLKLNRIDINYLNWLAGGDRMFKKTLRYEKIRACFSAINEEANEKFINKQLYQKLEQYDELFIKAPTGSGKTTLLNSILKLNKKSEKFKYPIASIVSRKSLAEKHSNELKLVLYTNEKEYYRATRLAVTVNSILKADLDKFKDCYLVLDELSKILTYMKAEILASERLLLYSRFCDFIQIAKKVICLDADLRQFDKDIILKIRKRQNPYLYVNNFKNRIGINAYIYNNPNIVAEKLFQDYQQEIPFVACFDSIKMMENMWSDIRKRIVDEEELKKFDMMSIKYSSKSDAIIDTQDWNSKMIFYTPVIIYGIDYNNVIPTKVYSFIFNRILTADEINQQIQRTRNQTEVHIYVNNIVKNAVYKSVAEVKEDTNTKINRIEDIKVLKEMVSCRKSEECTFIEDTFRELYDNTKFIEDTQKNNLRYYLENILKDMGYNLIYNNDTSNFKMTKSRNIVNNIEMDIVNNYFDDKQVSEVMKERIMRKICILALDPEKIKEDQFIKEVLSDDKKFTNVLNLKILLKGEVDEKIKYHYLNEFDETFIKNTYLKIKTYKRLSEILGITELIKFNYDTDKNKFSEKITDKKDLATIESARILFDLHGKYKNFDKNNGYKVLYKMTVGICRTLFGNKLINIKHSTVSKKVSSNKFVSITVKKYSINKNYLKLLYDLFGFQ